MEYGVKTGMGKGRKIVNLKIIKQRVRAYGTLYESIHIIPKSLCILNFVHQDSRGLDYQIVAYVGSVFPNNTNSTF